ncbi:MAG: hypothetical protein PF517_15445 [Salinivirgaceae bacterium]|jgi:GNAT superfamily N-acetyltransferase|nr:hypothetical protein [Salinivirgaceae bacterium]
MKKTLLITVALFIAVVLTAGNEKYYQKMGETLGQYATCKSVDDFQNLANQFNRISKMETAEWLPLYYEAHCYIIMSFIEQDVIKKDGFLDVAETAINKMIELQPNEAEVYALQAFFYTGRLVVDPASRGQKYGPMSGQAIGRSMAIDPTNPRARLMKLQNDLGTAHFFGNDVTPYYAQAEALLASWDKFEPKSQIHPVWGKDQVVGIVNSKK